MPGSHSKKDKLKKRIAKVRKAGAKKKAERKLPFSEYTVPEDYNVTDAQVKPSILSNAGVETSKPYWKKQIDKNTYDDYEKIPKGKDKRSIRKEIKRSDRDNFNVEQERKYDKSIKSSKVRKADQQDINRVKRWNSRSFNKKKELSGPTEPVFKPTAATNPLTGRPHPGMRGDELTAKLRNRLAKLRKANGGIAPNYNNPSKVRKKKTATKTAAGMANIGKKPWMQKDYLKKKGKHLEKTAAKKGRKLWNSYSDSQKKNIYSTYTGIKPQDVDVGGMEYEILPKYVKKSLQKDALRSAVNKGVNKVNTIKPTKTYKKPVQGPNPHAETPEGIRKNAEVVGRKNDTYIGKRIARIREATEQIDPRVKKRKTVRPDSPVQKVSQMKDRIAELKTAKEHSHSIAFRKHEGQYYRRASLQKQEGKYAKYWLLNAKQTNGNGWGVSPVSIAKNIHKFIGRPFVVTAKQWVAESEYGDQFEHPYLPTNNIDQIINHQEKFRVGSIVDVVEKDGDYHAVIEMNSKFANMMLPPFCSPAIFQNNPGEADGEISDWEALHLAGLMEDPAYGARIALLKGSCMGTAEACSIQFKGAKLTKTMCPKKKAKLVRRINRLGD